MNKLFICLKCGNIIEKIEDSGINVFCCGSAMEELVPNSKEAAFEKHVPIYTIEGNKVIVKVAEVEHPMTKEHYIKWIYLKTNNGLQRKTLSYNDKPEAIFYISSDDEVIKVYAYCNLHGLWESK